MKTFNEAFGVFININKTNTETEAHQKIEHMASRFGSIIDEVVKDKGFHEDVEFVLCVIAETMPSAGKIDLPNVFRTIAITFFVRGLIVGMEMERQDLTEEKVK